MKRTFTLLCCVLLLLALLLPVAAHPGRTDQYGGHWNHSTGEYHYHGVPDSNHSGSSNSNSSSSSKIPPPNTSTKSNDWIIPVVILSVLALPFLFGFIIFPLVDKIRSVFAPPSDEQSPTSPTQTTDAPPSPESTSPKPHLSTPKATTKSPETTKPSTSTSRPLPTKGSENHSARQLDSLKSTPTATASSPQPPLRPKSHIPRAASAPSWLLDIDPNYFTESQRAQFVSALDKDRAKRATTEPFVFKDLKMNKEHTPYRVTCSVISYKSHQEYQTSLISCTCKDYQTRHLPCKHMIALAIKVDAIVIDQAEVKDLI